MQYWIDSERNGEQLDACSDKLFTLLLHPLLSVMILVMNSNKYNIFRKTLKKQNIKLYKLKYTFRLSVCIFIFWLEWDRTINIFKQNCTIIRSCKILYFEMFCPNIILIRDYERIMSKKCLDDNSHCEVLVFMVSYIKYKKGLLE